ncbi:MAG: 3-deoxy-8-phosphooctulonate synthase [Thermodesulfobacteriota bacterium]
MDLREFYRKCSQELFFIAGPCVLESLELGMEVGEELASLGRELGSRIVFKSSFDKANRSSIHSYRGPGLEKGLDWLAQIREKTGLPVTTDIHLPEQASPVSEVADILQIPAFLSRQTDLLLAAADTQRIVNVKKGQFLAPWDMENVCNKLQQAGNDKIMLTERGSSFGYNNLVVDFRSFPLMQALGPPVVFDATHSVQIPGGLGGSSGGQRDFVPVLARSAVAAGCNGIFTETYPDPDRALCDGPNSWPLQDIRSLYKGLVNIGKVL